LVVDIYETPRKFAGRFFTVDSNDFGGDVAGCVFAELLPVVAVCLTRFTSLL
jgi:hypothetical protein